MEILYLLSIITSILIIGPAKCQREVLKDLTWNFSNETLYWTGMKNFSFTHKYINNVYVAYDFEAGEHGGTHLDAPFHFNQVNGWTIEQIPIDHLVGPGALINLEHETEKFGSRATLKIKHLIQWQKTYGNFQPGTLLLIKFGWSKYWPDKEKYFGIHNGIFNFPGISQAAAKWIVRSKRIVGVGLDTPSLDPGSATIFKAHLNLLNAQIFGMENVKLLEDLPATGFKLHALPMKIEGGTGAPLRLLATINS